MPAGYAASVAERVRRTAELLDRRGISHTRIGSSDEVVTAVFALLERSDVRAADPPPPGFDAPDLYAARWLGDRRGHPRAGGPLGRRRVVLDATAPGSGSRLGSRPTACHGCAPTTRGRSTSRWAGAARGEISQRAGHQQLSVLVRHFVQEVSGIHAPTMTLTELTATGHRLTPVSQVRRAADPGEFGPRETETLAGAGEVAEQVVGRWS